jgi:hypothetical protein
MTDDLLRAIELALADKWDDAHRIVQQFEGARRATWIHAVLHKIESDLDNNRYWYRRAGKMECVDQEPQAGLQSIKAEITG